MDVGVEFSYYRVIEHIGRGGMADVWSARDKRLNRVVAIKTVARDLSIDTDPVKMFEQEARTIAALEHPHILPIYDFGEYDRQLYIAMRYVAGGSLEDVLHQGPMPVDEALHMARSIGTALDHAHRNKVIHLDLKPSNILLDSQGQPYLADFGLAAVMDYEGRALNPGSGTLLYMAPEQVTSDLLDHRADVYSFCVLLFHIFTGTLPFDGSTPVALAQLQMGEEMPDISAIQLGLPYEMTLLLRHGTQVDIERRPNSVMEILEQLETLLTPSTVTVSAAPPSPEYTITGPNAGKTINLNAGNTIPLDTAEGLALREAIEIYQRARRAWAGGQGRFILGITDFILINDYYSQADIYGLELDDIGRQMMLRGALEYDYEVDFWWARLGEDAQRRVALHVVRGQNAAARVRALRRLEHLADTEPPQIPKLVAQALNLENNHAAKMAGIQVLNARAQYVELSHMTLNANTGRLSQTASVLFTRTLKLWTPGEWRDNVYGTEIDNTLATLALDRRDASAAELAARTIGRIRSKAALKQITRAREEHVKGSLRALALIRDEAPSLPGVGLDGRIYAWWANTLRRLGDQPMRMVWRFVWAFIGAALGIAQYVWFTFEQQPLFDPDRWRFTVSLGLFMGLFMGILVVLAGELPSRLRGFWPWWARLLLSAVIGIPLAIFIWGLYTYMFLSFTPEWQPLIPAGIGLALALVLSSIYRMPGWMLTLIMALATFVPLYTAYQSSRLEGSAAVLWMRPVVEIVDGFQTPVLDADGNPAFNPAMFTLGIPLALLFALGAFMQKLWRELRGGLRRRPAD
ncbi:MAG: serine/threonine protein kinase [Anaerolineae bacterium]|nr:serine/threonine protein kinase [Anaerolineae bacterium]